MSALLQTGRREVRRGALWPQVLLVYASLESALWTSGALQAVFAAVTMALTLAWTWSERGFWTELGLDPALIRRGWWIAPVGAGIAGLVVLTAWRWHTLRPPAPSPPIYLDLLLSLIWAFAQQFLLQSFFYLRLEQLLDGSRRAVIAAALLFSSAHIPNPVLIPVTLAGGLILTEAFRRYRTLYLLAVAHALVALCLAVSVPEAVLHNMRVGIAYLTYQSG